MSFKHNFYYNIILISFFFLFSNCQVNTKNHGILFLENRYNKLEVSKTNSNDVLQIVGNPHSRSISDEDTWIYIERILSKGKFHKLGQNVIKENNVMLLTFDKYGLLKEKQFFNKDKIASINFTKEITVNNLSEKSFVQELLQSIRSKMYRNR